MKRDGLIIERNLVLQITDEVKERGERDRDTETEKREKRRFSYLFVCLLDLPSPIPSFHFQIQGSEFGKWRAKEASHLCHRISSSRCINRTI